MTDFVILKSAERKHRKRELIRLMAARSDFGGARHACRMILEHAPGIGSDLNYPLVVAAVVCYARPFTRNEPYGALPASYLRAIPENLNSVHAEVLEARDTFFAHSDLSERPAYIFPKGAVVGREPKELRSAGLGSALMMKAYSPTFFRELGDLSTTMRRATAADIELLLEELYGGMDLPPIRFPLRIDNGL